MQESLLEVMREYERQSSVGGSVKSSPNKAPKPNADCKQFVRVTMEFTCPVHPNDPPSYVTMEYEVIGHDHFKRIDKGKKGLPVVAPFLCINHNHVFHAPIVQPPILGPNSNAVPNQGAQYPVIQTYIPINPIISAN